MIRERGEFLLQVQAFRDMIEENDVETTVQYRHKFMELLAVSGWDIYEPDEAKLEDGGWILSITFDKDSYSLLMENHMTGEVYKEDYKIKS